MPIPDFDTSGNLPPGIHHATWEEFTKRFGGTAHRDELLKGLKTGLASLKAAGCPCAYIDGSFVTDKAVPHDFDACWDEHGVDGSLLDPVLLDFSNLRAAQKAKFNGEFFPMTSPAKPDGTSFLDFFQTDRATSQRKGIVALDLTKFKP